MTIDRRQADALARDAFHLFAGRLKRDGLEPDDPVVGQILATMVAAHWVWSGSTAEKKRELLDLIADVIDLSAGR